MSKYQPKPKDSNGNFIGYHEIKLRCPQDLYSIIYKDAQEYGIGITAMIIKTLQEKFNTEEAENPKSTQ
tara:strand:+ start:500 stop:706 length:207 start_codon:yes stop_codon:yes gene_type:complete